ncbi:hypothetical protein [Evansella cellulosilytica]|uniref:Yip1 domain-containing protein n=1 Tax=Evansella cellulosilytica (strain ATCC 21833 / DSM 2522 / FERM P-1141 / JCM 9156 / N-4) TaxID=649639 RepID=E6TQM3_EVAC2|nr:hypothetical protein [Evansella cellulosilytica]ADU30534.1 hypothetical protein Bcell_2274 [Evansella cellulosilytica DSM 2522]
MSAKKQLNYIQYIMRLLKHPDDIITEEYKGFRKFGMVNIVIMAILLFLHSIIQEFSINNIETIYDVHLYQSVVFAISYIIPLITILLFMNWVATKMIDKQSIAYYVEKMGAVTFFPSLLLSISIIFYFYHDTIFSLMSSLAFTFIYIGVFVVSYLFSARFHFKISMIFVVLFYLFSKFIYYIL